MTSLTHQFNTLVEEYDIMTGYLHDDVTSHWVMIMQVSLILGPHSQWVREFTRVCDRMEIELTERS